MEKKEAGAVKVIDKERDGSKMVIARGKKKRAAEDSREKDRLQEVFLHLAAMLH